ncbi:hypothetical protein BAE44_0017713 [Dichanthelium oligosanthes]|uniref:Bifunctional inhibitor/plant lipid transfer protein/seed storage helical domain-containing protein n=1 Tax=Dichanthelium oligosanthes TaxID=888268 RepID=A0A1E5V7Y9_9POAL|nr:hypothetical protein BAE44_0017713 [Dichanthelium oligosanthes]
MAAVAACIALVLLSMGPPAMADIQDKCRVFCQPKCDGFTTEVCRSLLDIVPIVNLDFFFRTCKVRVSSPCSFLCINVCSLDTFTPTPTPPPPPPPSTPASPPPPPCKPY